MNHLYISIAVNVVLVLFALIQTSRASYYSGRCDEDQVSYDTLKEENEWLRERLDDAITNPKQP